MNRIRVKLRVEEMTETLEQQIVKEPQRQQPGGSRLNLSLLRPNNYFGTLKQLPRTLSSRYLQFIDVPAPLKVCLELSMRCDELPAQGFNLNTPNPSTSVTSEIFHKLLYLPEVEQQTFKITNFLLAVLYYWHSVACTEY